MQDVLRESAIRTAFAANARFRNVSVLLGVLLVGLHCFNSYIAYYLARETATFSPLSTDAFVRTVAPLTVEEIVAKVLAAQDFVEVVGNAVQRTLVTGVTVRSPLPGTPAPRVTLALVDGRFVDL